MTLSEFNRKTAENKLIDNNAVGKIMELMLDMPLDKMYSSEMNHIPETGEFDPYAAYLISNTALNNRAVPSITLRELIPHILNMSKSNDNNHAYRRLCKNLALWHQFFVPFKYEEKE